MTKEEAKQAAQDLINESMGHGCIATAEFDAELHEALKVFASGYCDTNNGYDYWADYDQYGDDAMAWRVETHRSWLNR